MPLMKPGTDVEVRSTFDGEWVSGFQIIETMVSPARGYRVRRRSDRFVLPRPFSTSELRAARRQHPVRRRRLLVA